MVLSYRTATSTSIHRQRGPVPAVRFLRAQYSQRSALLPRP